MGGKRIARRAQIPIGYVESNPDGNRASRRMAAKEAKAERRGRQTGHSAGGASIGPTVRAAVADEDPFVEVFAEDSDSTFTWRCSSCGADGRSWFTAAGARIAGDNHSCLDRLFGGPA